MQKIPKIKPVSQEYPLGWHAGTSDEYMDIGGPFASREDAIAAGRHNQCGEKFYICQAALYSWTAPSADEVIDQWIENHDELWWEDGFGGFDGRPDAEVIAHDDLQAVLNDWFQRNRAMLPTPTAFCVHNLGEWVDEPVEENRHD